MLCKNCKTLDPLIHYKISEPRYRKHAITRAIALLCAVIVGPVCGQALLPNEILGTDGILKIEEDYTDNTYNYFFYGRKTTDDTASENSKVIIEKNVTVSSPGGAIIAGESLSGIASNNSVEISAGIIELEKITAAYGRIAENNSVTIRGGTFKNFIVSGLYSLRSPHCQSAVNNTVTLTGTFTVSSDTGLVRGAELIQGKEAIGNKVVIEKLQNKELRIGDAIGAVANFTQTVLSNEVRISDSELSFYTLIAGARTHVADNEQSKIQGNSVVITSSTVKNVRPTTYSTKEGIGGATLCEHNPKETVLKNNSVDIRAQSHIESDVFGVQTEVPLTNQPFKSIATLEANSVTVSDSTVIGNIYAAKTDGGTLKENFVRITQGSQITGNIYGSYGARQESSANSVEIVDSTVNGDVWASFAIDVATSSRNRVYLENATINGFVGVTQGHQSTESNVICASGINKIQGFGTDSFDRLELIVGKENYTTDLSQIGANNAVITLTESGLIIDDKHPLEVKINGAAEKWGYYSLIHNDGSDKLTLEKGANITLAQTFTENKYTYNQETVIEKGKTLYLSQSDKSVDRRVTDNAKTLSESLLATAAFVTQGAEFFADYGIDAMIEEENYDRLAVFGAASAASNRYLTGSHIDIKGVMLATGVATRRNNLALGTFLELGWADSTDHVHNTKADGKHRYYGLGLAGRYDFDNRSYLSGALRFGNTHTRFQGRYTNDRASYKADTLYWSAHVQLGHLFALTSKIDVDVYGRYLVSFLKGDDVTLNNREHSKLHLSSITAQAMRIGARLLGQTDKQNLKWMTGLGYEHVFGGDADSRVDGLTIDPPSLSGDTAIVEIGLVKVPAQGDPWGVTVALKGNVGDRRGLHANFDLSYSF